MYIYTPWRVLVSSDGLSVARIVLRRQIPRIVWMLYGCTAHMCYTSTFYTLCGHKYHTCIRAHECVSTNIYIGINIYVCVRVWTSDERTTVSNTVSNTAKENQYVTASICVITVAPQWLRICHVRAFSVLQNDRNTANLYYVEIILCLKL